MSGLPQWEIVHFTALLSGLSVIVLTSRSWTRNTIIYLITESFVALPNVDVELDNPALPYGNPINTDIPLTAFTREI